MANPQGLIVPLGSWCNFKGRLEIVNGLLALALDTIDSGKKAVGLAEQEFLAFLGEDIGRAS